MSKIGGGGHPPKDLEAPKTPAETQPADLRSKEGVKNFREAGAKENVPATVLDRFERHAPQIEKQLQNISGKALAGRLQFTNEQLAQIAGTFAAVLKQHPRADRKDRAKLFARAVLKHRRIGKLFEEADEEDVEQMFERVAEQLEGSPVFAQLVDEVTENARKFDLG